MNFLAMPTLKNVRACFRRPISMMTALLVEGDVGEGAHGDGKGWILAPLRRGNHEVGDADELLFYGSVTFWFFSRHVSFLSFGFVFRWIWLFQIPKSFVCTLRLCALAAW